MHEFNFIIRDNKGIEVLHKVMDKREKMMSDVVLKVSPFGIRSYERGKENI